MPRYIYLDSNAFWLMKPEHKLYDEEFRNVVKNLHQRYRFPISEAHFLDLATSDQPGNEEKVKFDLNFLASASKKYAVAIDVVELPPAEYHPTPGPISGRGWIIHHQIGDVAAMYFAMDKSTLEEPHIEVQGTSHSVDMRKVSENHPLKGLLQANNGMFTPKLLETYLEHLRKESDDPKTYKNFRRAVVDALNKIDEQNTLIGHNTRQLEPLKKFLCAKGIRDVTETLVEATSVLIEMGGKKIESLPWVDKLTAAYSLLDFHREQYEKIDKKNRPSNMRRDAKHLIYAAGAEHMVTQDKTFATKTKIVFAAFDIRTKISNLAEFKLMFP